MGRTKRKYIDCREFPSDNKCSLRISGREEEVLVVAVKHAVDEHGHKNTPELKREIRKLMKDEK
jgi:hypothetical protein